MKKAIATMLLLAGGMFVESGVAAPRVRVGIGFGVPAPAAVVRPVCPGPGYNWVDGYYGPTGAWMAGYWAPPAVVRIAPPIAHARVFDRGFADHRFEDRRAEHFRR